MRTAPSSRASCFWHVIVTITLLVCSELLAAQQDKPSGSVRDRPRPAYDPFGIRVGVLELDARIGIGVEYSDNIFASSENEFDDIITILRPSVAATADWGRTSLVVSGDLKVARHSDFSSEDFDDHALGAQVRRRVGSDGRLRLRVATANGHDSRRVPTDEDGFEPNQYTNKIISAGYAGRFGEIDLDLGLRAEDIDYDDSEGPNGVINNDDRDRRDNELRFRIGIFDDRPVMPFVNIDVDERDYDLFVDSSGISRSSDGSAIGVGLWLNQFGTLDGEVLVGQISRSYADPRLSDIERFWSRSRIEWNPTGLTTFGFQYETRIDETTIINSAGIEVEELRFVIDHELLRNVILSAGIRSKQEDYVASSRRDDVVRVSFEATYLISNRFRASFEFESNDRDSSATNQSFSENSYRTLLQVAL